jgi:BlaI family penicillinase repressor
MIIKLQNTLSKRERQIMDVIYRRKSGSVKEVREDILDPPSYSTVRALMSILEKKGFLKHRKNGKKYIYSPTIPRKRAMYSAIKHILQMYFNNSVEEAVEALIEVNRKALTDKELDRLTELIEKVREEENGVRLP